MNRKIAMLSLIGILCGILGGAVLMVVVVPQLSLSYSRETKVGLHVPEDYPTIAEAVAAASPGDIIYVAAGTHYLKADLIIDKPVTLRGESSSTTIIDGGDQVYYVIQIRPRYYELMNGTRVYVTPEVDNVEISGFTVKKGFQETPGGIRIESSKNCTIRDNIIISNDHGVCLDNSTSINIVGNTIRNSGAGVFLHFSSFNNISHNTISGGQVGVVIGAASNSNRITANIITSNSYCGIEVGNSTLNYIVGNEISANRYGVEVTISNDNTFYHNNFINNRIQQVYFVNFTMHPLPISTNMWDNGVEGNYWSDYNGTDANGDGIGDTSYIINENNQDNHPLMNPYTPTLVQPVPDCWGEVRGSDVFVQDEEENVILRVSSIPSASCPQRKQEDDISRARL